MLLMFSLQFARAGPNSWPIAPAWTLIATPRLLSFKASYMPFVGDFSPVGAVEIVPFTIDFAAQIPAGDSLASAIGSVAAYAGADANAAGLIYGAAVVSGTKATQWAGPGWLPNVTYRLTLTATTAAGAVLSLYGHVACAPVN